MSADNPQNPYTVSLPAGATPQFKSIGRGGEIFYSEDHGKYYTGSYYNRLFSFNRTAVTIPVPATNMVSVFSLYNPPGSTVNLELVDFDLGLVLATTVVDTVGLYWQGPTLASLATLTTKAVFGTTWFPGILNGLPGQGNPYTALTHSAANVGQLNRIDILGQFGAVTSTNDTPIHKDFDGKTLITPGCVVSVAMSTAAGTGSGLDPAIRWLEASVN